MALPGATERIDGHRHADVFFTIPHFDGYPAVLVRLDLISHDQLREIVTDAWLVRAPKRAAREWLAQNAPPHGDER